MKYTEDRIRKIERNLIKMRGRVNACKSAGIHYDTFSHWMKTKPEFNARIKKAEKKGQKWGREYAIMSIFRAMATQWTAGAWWLERNFPREFKERQQFEHQGDVGVRIYKPDIKNE